MSAPGRVAVFIDRDGTIIDDPGYLSEPAKVHLLPGAAEALIELERAGFARIVITNQSGIGRGFYRVEDFLAVEAEIERQLAAQGASIDLFLWCPHAPEDGCTCRKPGTALHREAAARLGVETAGSWCVGDRLSDLQPSLELAGRAVLVTTGQGSRHIEAARKLGATIVADLLAAAALIISGPG
jgi:D-glycero-D-manno-heptose 1,7-bisphosphate phosphatase